MPKPKKMTKDDIRYFISGLKAVINEYWSTQEEFAKGVTSKVNLSNVLNGNSGTSREMREKLATKAGMTVEDLIAIGKGSKPIRVSDSPVASTLESTPVKLPFSPDELSSFDSSELIRRVNDYAETSTDQLASQLKIVWSIVRMLINERVRLVDLLQQEQKIVNSIDEAIKVINMSYQIIYCNRACTELHQQHEGDHCTAGECASCNGNCLAEQVFTTGRPAESLVKVNGSWLYQRIYPLSSPTGKICQVIILSQRIDNLIDMLKKHGWKLNKKNKS